MELTEAEHEILEFERGWWKYPGTKGGAIRDRFGISSTHYYQLLSGLVERPEALAYDPLVVKRLRRLRDARRVRRARLSASFVDG